MEGIKVQCPSCKRILHETTSHYQPDIRPNGSMVRLLDPWRSWGWDAFDNEGQAIASTSCALMNCPACAAALAPSGRLTIVEPENVLICEVCGRECKSVGGLGAHMRTHENNA